jgi:RNA polymerase sigma-70 factor (ECF subfamily)
MAKVNAEAFDALYRRYAERVYRYCYTRTGNQQDAEDLTAQIFMAALESLGRYRERHCFAAWLFGIARNVCAAYHRCHYRHPEVNLAHDSEDWTLIALTEAVTLLPNPEHRLDRQALIQCMRTAIQSLSDERREALYLRFWSELKTQEIAAVMDKTVGAVKMLVWRGIQDLRRRCHQ